MTDDWRADAACREYPSEFWFPDKGGRTADAKRVCAGCPVAAPCLELGHSDPNGIYGGKTPIERRRLRRATRRAAA